MKPLYSLVISCLLLSACGTTKADSGATEHHQGFKPKLNVTWEVSGDQITVNVDTDLHISPEHYGQARQDGEGHIHMYLDGGEKVGVKTHQHVFPDLDPGKHTLKVSLHNNDHTPYDVTKSFEFEIK